MMKKILLNGMLLAVALLAKAETTTDYVTLSTATLNPGGSPVQITVSLNGTEGHLYTGYNIDITLPEGMSVAYNSSGNPRVTMSKSGGLYPSTYDEDADETTYSHTLSCSYGAAGARVLRVACISTKNEAFTSTSGKLFTVYLEASAYTKPGIADIALTNTDFGVYDADAGTTTPYHFDDATSDAITVSTSATASITVSGTTQWSTCILPFSHSIPSGVTAYTCASKTTEGGDDYLILSPAATMDGYTPYVLFSESGYSGTLEGTVDATQYPSTGYVTSGYLNGAIQAQQVNSGYVLQNQDGGVKFYNMNGQSFAIPAGKCWVTLPNECKAVGMVIGDETAVNQLTTDSERRKAVVYDLSGRKSLSPLPRNGEGLSKGIYIINGRKVLNSK